MAITLTIEDLEKETEPVLETYEQPLLSVGRSKSCTRVLDHPLLSRHHFLIKYVEGNYVLVDEGSLHGTLLDEQKLTPGEIYPLGKSHLIEIPGFRINLHCDEEKPKAEHTRIVARQMMDLLLTDDEVAKEPVLEAVGGQYIFHFEVNKTGFSLGSQANMDFVIPDAAFAKSYATFIRDLSGINLIPIAGCPAKINGTVITTMQTLVPGDRVGFGEYEFIFKENHEPELNHGPQSLSLAQNRIPQKTQATPKENSLPTLKNNNEHAISRHSFVTSDKMFFAAFFIAFFGALIVVWQLV
jgi:hypothetical protein